MNSADIIITNARLLTMDRPRPEANALAITGNRISAIGSASEIAAHRGSNTRMIDAQMQTVMPGIVESHLHLFFGSVEMEGLSVNHIKGLPALTESVREFAKKRPNDPVIVAYGATYLMLRDEGGITRQDLDHVVKDRPFILVCFDHHTVWANTLALEKAGLLHGRSLPVGNEVVMGKDGRATGELKEAAAFSPVLALMPTAGRDWLGMTTAEDPSPPATPAERRIDQDYMRKGLEYCASLGITSLHNMDGNFYQLELLKEMRERGELIARVEVPYHHKSYFDIGRLDDALRMREMAHDDMLHSGRVKIFMDGVIESMTAFMLDDYPGAPGNRGAPLFTAEQFNDVATRADAHGLRISVHAIGDAGVRRTLDGFEAARKANGARDSRHRIEHIEVIDKADVPRLKELGVIASLQPIVGLGVPGALLEPCFSLLANKLPMTYAWQTLRNAGAQIAFSSDWPISPLNPFLGMQAAMTQVPLRPDCPPQAQSLMDSVHAFTLGGAYCEFMEDRKGMLKEGHLADVIVLDRDIERTAAAEIGKVRVLTTICDGRVTYEA